MQTHNKFPFKFSPRAKRQAERYLELIYGNLYIDRIAPNKCAVCKTPRTRRTIAEATFGQEQRSCRICFDFCPKCLRVKEVTPLQEKRMGRVSNIRPLDPGEVQVERKIAEEVAKGRNVFTTEEFDSWRKIPDSQPAGATLEGSCTNG